MIINEGGGQMLPNLTNPGIAADLVANKQLIGPDGNIINGTMPIVTHSSPIIAVGANGLITATHNQESGKVTGGTTQSTHQLTVQDGTTITPGTAQKTAVASGRYTTGPVYVAGDANLKASNIKLGVSIFGVTGTYSVGQGYDIKVATGYYKTAVVSAHIQTVAFDVPDIIKGLLAVEIKAPDALSGSINSQYWGDGYQVMWMNGLASSSTPASELSMSGFVHWLSGGNEFEYGPAGYSGVPNFSVKAAYYNYSGLSEGQILFHFEGSTDLWIYGTTCAPSGLQYRVVYAV